MDTKAYFATAISYAAKMFMKLTTGHKAPISLLRNGTNFIKLFYVAFLA